jgi:hypothetical protein
MPGIYASIVMAGARNMLFFQQNRNFQAILVVVVSLHKQSRGLRRAATFEAWESTTKQEAI